MVYAATEETRKPAYVSPFVGRLDEIGQNGMDVLKNIRRMFLKGHGHVLALAVSIRSVEHPFYCFVRQDRASNRAAKILELWASKHSPMPDEQFQYNASGKPTHTRSLTPSKRGNRLIYNTNLRARVSKNSRLDYPATLSQPA